MPCRWLGINKISFSLDSVLSGVKFQPIQSKAWGQRGTKASLRLHQSRLCFHFLKGGDISLFLFVGNRSLESHLLTLKLCENQTLQFSLFFSVDAFLHRSGRSGFLNRDSRSSVNRWWRPCCRLRRVKAFSLHSLLQRVVPPGIWVIRLPVRMINLQTMVQTVFRLGSKRTAFPSTALVLVLYMGFSKAAWPLLFSWTEQPVYWVFGVVLRKRQIENYQNIYNLTTTLQSWRGSMWTIKI